MYTQFHLYVLLVRADETCLHMCFLLISGTSFTWTGAKKDMGYTFTLRCLSVDGKSYTSDFDNRLER